MRVYVLIPAYNEERTIRNVVSEVKKYVDQVIVVDDGSTDATSSEAMRGGAFVLRHIINRGQGAALQTGFDYLKRSNLDGARSVDRARSTSGASGPLSSALGSKHEGDLTLANDYIAVTFDADGQFEASEIPRLVEPIKNGRVDVVLGSRFLERKEPELRVAPAAEVWARKEQIPVYKKFLLKCAVVLTNVLTGLTLTDTHNGFRALSAKAVDLITVTQDRMAHGSEILFEIVKHNLSYEEAPVTVKYSAYSLSKGQKLGDYFKILFDLFLRKLVQ